MTRTLGLLAGLMLSATAAASGPPASPFVILLPDATGDEGRSEPYVDALSARGIATLVLGFEEADEGPRASLAPAPSRDAEELARSWAAGEMLSLAGRGVALIGFGAAARVVLGTGDAPVVALDPGCRGLSLPARSAPALLVHGLAAPDARDCAALDGSAGLERLALRGITHGWDLPVVVAPAGALLPDPANGGRRRSRPDPIATAAVAEAVAAWLAARLQDGAR
ncbi:hypothetical protein [Neoroseomonas oryzicola]|uniref:Alpha/beta hydrolase n=1 Tax=Neoroseomonas oryzicola TaxID=535904 RepID=A0A9X9WCU5_9PROT|nr:hypothetical protein [Neoroseomonas oryzicola]MBR0658155.1 hypothetical protein [Neoroseomonas oryzicola]NKE16028.1 hypothetical protein [Neoroseomonas oryzicola]